MPGLLIIRAAVSMVGCSHQRLMTVRHYSFLHPAIAMCLASAPEAATCTWGVPPSAQAVQITRDSSTATLPLAI